MGWRDGKDGGMKRQTDTELAGPSGEYSSGSNVIKTTARPAKQRCRHHLNYMVTGQTLNRHKEARHNPHREKSDRWNRKRQQEMTDMYINASKVVGIPAHYSDFIIPSLRFNPKRFLTVKVTVLASQ